MSAPAPTAPVGTRVRPAHLAHVVLRTQQLEPMAEWWANVLQADVVFKNAFLAFLTFDEEHHRVAIAQHPHSNDAVQDSVGLDHVAFTYDSLGDLIATYERLLAEGITSHWIVNHGPTLSLYYRDPDGNQAELQIDRFATPEQATAFFESDTFRRHPVGHSVDFEDLVRRFHAGEPTESLIA